MLNRVLFSILVGVFSFSCTPKSSDSDVKKEESKAEPSAAAAELKPADKGKQVYQVQCTACHNANPKMPGALGPEVWGSSKELLEARIMKAEYPPNYKPKRPTKTMVALPHLKSDIDALHAYLNQ